MFFKNLLFIKLARDILHNLCIFFTHLWLVSAFVYATAFVFADVQMPFLKLPKPKRLLQFIMFYFGNIRHLFNYCFVTKRWKVSCD